MKIKESYLHEALKADQKREAQRSSNDTRRQTSFEPSESANKIRQNDSPLKEDLKFANLLESSVKLQKNQGREDSGEERREDQRKDKKHADQEKAAHENLTGDANIGKYESGGSQTGGGQNSGFGMGGQISGLTLSDNFAARSILHIADLERLVSTVRSQTRLGGKREIILQLKRSVLEGLQVKIVTGESSKVDIEFLAANKNIQSQVENHAAELAGILRDRGINLGSLTSSLKDDRDNEKSAVTLNTSVTSDPLTKITGDEAENTFGESLPVNDKIYQA